jgi:hypothetical protein
MVFPYSLLGVSMGLPPPAGGVAQQHDPVGLADHVEVSKVMGVTPIAGEQLQWNIIDDPIDDPHVKIQWTKMLVH